MYDLEDATQRLNIPFLAGAYNQLVTDSDFVRRYDKQSRDGTRRTVIKDAVKRIFGKDITQDQAEYLNAQLNIRLGLGQIVPYEGDDGNRVSPIMEICYGIQPQHTEKESEETTMNTTSNSNAPLIARKVFIRGVDASTLTNETIFSHIAGVEAEIKKLDQIETKPKTLQKQIEDMRASVQELADFVDERNGVVKSAD